MEITSLIWPLRLSPARDPCPHHYTSYVADTGTTDSRADTNMSEKHIAAVFRDWYLPTSVHGVTTLSVIKLARNALTMFLNPYHTPLPRSLSASATCERFLRIQESVMLETAYDPFLAGRSWIKCVRSHKILSTRMIFIWCWIPVVATPSDYLSARCMTGQQKLA